MRSYTYSSTFIVSISYTVTAIHPLIHCTYTGLLPPVFLKFSFALWLTVLSQKPEIYRTFHTLLEMTVYVSIFSSVFKKSLQKCKHWHICFGGFDALFHHNHLLL